MKRLQRRESSSGLPPGEKAAAFPVGEQELYERVTQRAYDLYEKRGRTDGCDVEDWLQAERLVLDKIGSQRSTSK